MIVGIRTRRAARRRFMRWRNRAAPWAVPLGLLCCLAAYLALAMRMSGG